MEEVIGIHLMRVFKTIIVKTMSHDHGTEHDSQTVLKYPPPNRNAEKDAVLCTASGRCQTN